MTLDEEWQRWCERFDRTHNGVVRLFHDRAIWRTIMAMLAANPAVPRGGFGEYWLGSCYTDSMFIGIRRETDVKGTGLRRALKQLEATPRIATRDWCMRQAGQRDHDGWALAEMESGFNLFADPGDAFIDSARVTKDIAELEAVVTCVNAYTSKVIAHRDADITRLPARPVTWGELDAALDAIGRLHRKYYRLRHPGESLGGLTPLVSPGWILMFGEAWMSSGFAMPNRRDLDPAGL